MNHFIYFLIFFCLHGLLIQAEAHNLDRQISGPSLIAAIKESETAKKDYWGLMYGNSFKIKLTDDEQQLRNSLWKLEYVESEERDDLILFVSQKKLSAGLSVEQYLEILMIVHEVDNWQPFRALGFQEAALDPSAKSQQVASALRLDFLQFMTKREGVNSSQVLNEYLISAFKNSSDVAPMSALIQPYMSLFPQNTSVDALAKELFLDLQAKIQVHLKNAEPFLRIQQGPLLAKDTSSSVLQLSEKIKANDRLGVAKILDESLPWDRFTTAETIFYRQYIESIVRPDPKRILYVLRGTNTTLDPEPEKNGLISKAFKKFQPTQDSIAKIYDSYRSAWIGKSNNRKTSMNIPFFENLAEAHAFSSGAKEGFPSALISTTTSAGVVSTFAKGTRLVIAIDSRRIVPSFESNSPHEMEALIPLLVFPDEIAGFMVKKDSKKWEVRKSDNSFNANATEFLIKNLVKKEDAIWSAYDLWRSALKTLYPASMENVEIQNSNPALEMFSIPSAKKGKNKISCSSTFM